MKTSKYLSQKSYLDLNGLTSRIKYTYRRDIVTLHVPEHMDACKKTITLKLVTTVVE